MPYIMSESSSLVGSCINSIDSSQIALRAFFIVMGL